MTASKAKRKNWDWALGMRLDYPISLIMKIIFNKRDGGRQMLQILHTLYRVKAVGEDSRTLQHRYYQIADIIQKAIVLLDRP